MWKIIQPSEIQVGIGTAQNFVYPTNSLIITTKNAISRGWIDYLKIKDYHIYDKIEPNPSIDNIEKLISEFGLSKNDLEHYLPISNKEFRISIKTGIGGAFHQEPEETFIKFLKAKTNIDENKISFLSKFLRSDEIKIKNSSLAKFFDKNKSILISRVFSGRFNEPDVHYYFFCPLIDKYDTKEIRIKKIEKGKYINKISLIEFVNNNKSNGECPIGRLTFQAYGRLRGTSVQFKWGTCYNDIK